MKTIQMILSTAVCMFLMLFTAQANVPVPEIDLSALNLEQVNSRPAFKDVSICRMQIKVKTNGIKHANTDSPVYAQLNHKDVPFYLDLPGDDREKNRTNTYDILSPNINKISDIQFLKLRIMGEDGWNMREISLLVNGVSIYHQSFGSKGFWIDKGSKNHVQQLLIPLSKLRRYPNYRYNSVTTHIWKGPSQITKAFLVDLVESAVGNSIQKDKNLKWGKKHSYAYVEARRINSKTLRFDLDLEYEVRGPNATIDVDFDLVFTCENGVVKTVVKNYKARALGPMAFLARHMGKIKKILYATCAKADDPKIKYPCTAGVWLVAHLLDFNFNYAGPGAVGIGKECSNSMKLDSGGNLILGKPKSSNARQTLSQRYNPFQKLSQKRNK